MIINNMCECPISILSRVLNANVNHLESMTENINEKKSSHIYELHVSDLSSILVFKACIMCKMHNFFRTLALRKTFTFLNCFLLSLKHP